MNKVFRDKKLAIKILSAISAAAIVTGGIAFYLSKDTRVLASAMAEGREVPQYLDSISAINYATILGRATDFGIVANDFEQVTHMETTFAVNTFSNSSGQVNEVDFITNSAQFMIGQIGEGKIKFGSNQTARSYNFEASSAVFDNFGPEWSNGHIFNDTNENISNFYFDDARNTWRGTSARPVYTVIKEQESIVTNINNVIGNATASSDYISQRAQDPAYALDYTQYLTLESIAHAEYDPMDPNTGNINTANRFFINIDKAEFVNKVVYINVDENLARVMANSEGLCIIKDPSTVVAFNIEPGISNAPNGGLILNRICVSEDGGENFCWSVTASQGNSTDAQSTGTVGRRNTQQFTNADVDRMINQKIILNVRSNSQDIELDAIAGTTIIPNPSSIANVKGSSTGWVVAGGKLRNAGGEWHYIYQGGSQDLINQTTGNEIHFALHKSFTSDNGLTTDNTVFINEGQFTFNLYQLGNITGSDKFDSIGLSDISDATRTITAENKATGNVQFDPMSLTPGDYYFIITENSTQNDPYVDNSIQNSDGYIKIHVKVEAGNPANSFTVHYAYYMHANDQTPFREENNVVMMGVQFDLLQFYNFVQPTGSISIDKSVLGVTSVPDNYVAPVYVKSGDTYYGVDEYGALITSSSPIVNNVHPGSTYIIRDLPLGQTYSVTEAAARPSIDGYTFVEVTGERDDITLTANNVSANVSLINTYSQDSNDNVLHIAKIASDTNQLLEGAVFTLTYNGTNQFDVYSIGVNGVSGVTRNGSSISFTTVDSANVSFTGLPDGTYTLREDTAPSGYSAVSDISFELSGNVVTLAGGTASSVSMNNTTHIMTIVDNSDQGTLTINKAIALDSHFSGTVTKNDLDTIEFKIAGPATFNNGAPMYVTLNAFTYDDTTQNWVFSQAVPAGNYTITETRNGTNSNYSCVTTVNSASGTSGQVSISANATETISFRNEYSPTKGSLVIRKTVYGITDIASVGGVTFTITPPQGVTIPETTVTLDSDWQRNGWTKNGNVYTYTIPGVDPGRYTISESVNGSNGSYTCTVVPTNGVSYATVYAGDIPIVPANYTNTYTRVTGTVEISKIIAGGVDELPGASLQIIPVTSGLNLSECRVTGGGASSASVTTNRISFISGTARTSIAGLPAGEYILRETAAPSGYLVATDISFTVNNDGSVSGDVTYVSNGVIQMADKPVSIDISKIELAPSGSTDTYRELPGATICIAPTDTTTDISGLTVVTGNGAHTTTGDNPHAIYFVSGNSATTVQGLPDGSYTLTETTVPSSTNGYYSTATSISFTISNGSVTSSTVAGVVASGVDGNHYIEVQGGANPKFELFDAFTSSANIDISKIELAPAGSTDTYQELPGATICIASTNDNDDISGVPVIPGTGATLTNGDNSKAVYFISGTTPTTVCLPDGTYELTETAVPTSALGTYSTASTVRFTIEQGVVVDSNIVGVVTSGDGNHFVAANGNSNAKFELFDTFTSSASTEIAVSKIELAPAGSSDTYQELPGATICIASTNANDDISGATVTYNGGAHGTTGANTKAIYFVSGTEATTVSLPDGTYTLTETIAPSASNGYYSLATEIEFTISNGQVTYSNTSNIVASDQNGNHFTDSDANGHPRFEIFDAFTYMTKVDVSKIELDTGSGNSFHELPGATICIASTDVNDDISGVTVNLGTGANNATGTNARAVYFVSGSAPTTVTLPDGSYTLTETATPASAFGTYTTATTIEFTIDKGVVTYSNVSGIVASDQAGNHYTAPSGNSNAKFELFDAFTATDITDIEISKITLDTGNTNAFTEIAGATICIESVNANDDISGAAITYGTGAGPASATAITNPRAIYFESGTSPTTVSLPNGTYILSETTVPTASNGYYSVATSIRFTIANGSVTDSTVTNTVAGDAEGNHYITTGTTPRFELFDAFTPVTSVDISKIELAPAGSANTYQELSGATICIAPVNPSDDISGAAITYGTAAVPATGTNSRAIYFVSGTSATTVDLPDGTYTLTEVTAPSASNGYYSVATDIQFTIENGNVTSSNVTGTVATDAAGNHFVDTGSNPRFELFDAFTRTTDIDVSKIELAPAGSTSRFAELPGATICIESTDTTVDISGVTVNLGTGANNATGTNPRAVYFVSGSTATTISLPDGSYRLTETAVPTSADGTYSTCSEVEFTISGGAVTGSTITNVVSLNSEGNHYIGSTYGTNSRFELFDAFTANQAPVPSTTTVAISKQNVSGTELVGATLQLTGTAANGPVVFDASWYTPGQDASATPVIQDNGHILQFVSGSAPSTISNLPDGTYTLEETVAPQNYPETYLTTVITFTISNGAVTTTSTDARVDTTSNVPMVVMIDRVDTSSECVLTLNKVVVISGGTAPSSFVFNVKCGDTYYGLDANGALISDSNPIAISVTPGTSVSLSGLPAGTYEVTEVRDGTAVQGYDLTVTGEGSVSLDPSDPATKNGSVTITNTYTSTAPATGSLTIIKDIGSNAPASAYTMTYVFTVTGPGFSQDVSITGAGRTTLTGLNPGTYTITEQAASASIGGYQWTASGNGATVLVEAGVESTVTITNNYVATVAPTSATTTSESTSASSVETTEATSETLAPVIPTTTTEVATTVFISAMDINISKQDIAGAEIDGAVLTITNAPGNSVNFLAAGVTATQNGLPATGLEVTADKLQFTTVSSSQALIHQLPIGNYVLTETIAPRGYLIAESINFEVRSDGTIWVAGTPEDQMVERIVMQDLADPTVGAAARTTPVVNRVMVNGTEITSDNFTINSDGTVTISEAYARVLGVGRHRIEVVMSDGTTRILYVTVNEDGSVVQTGESRVSASSMLAVVLIASGGFVFAVRKKKLSEES
ncbi:Cna protein B-type domain-containing protein [Oscillospiraceae bacterium]|nr:Cna protein B-type domain-containing protein [Oscillospiraceae bacterium]